MTELAENPRARTGKHSSRAEIWAGLSGHSWDVIVVGGGITGAGVARESARRGLRTLLLEQRDYAWGTSSRSSKMVHGGLRYIAQGDIRLVRHALAERERLLREAPGLITRMGYWFAHYRGLFPGRRVFGLVLALYDFLAGVRDHHFSARADFLARMPGFRQDGLSGASHYSDALVDDARLVLRVLDEARADGAWTLNYVKAVDLVLRDGMVAGVRARDELGGAEAMLTARLVVNATGAWADRLRARLVGESRVRPQRGSHVVLSLERLPITEAVIFTHPQDKRPVFIYPWEGRCVIGTTDVDHDRDLDEEPGMTAAELDYLLAGANLQFPAARLTPADIIASFSGVRPIVASGSHLDPSQERRDHIVWDDRALITVTGGKLTTFRLIALDVLKAARRYLPGVDLRDDDLPVFRRYEPVRTTRVAAPVLARLEGRFGFLAAQILREADPDELQPLPETDLLWAELRWAARHEQVAHLDDLLLRRTRLGILARQGGAEFLPRLGQICRAELGWSDARWDAEAVRYRDIWRDHYSLPPGEGARR